MLGIGTVELAIIAVITVWPLVLNRYGYLSMRLALAVLGCATIGALITPADVASMLVMTVVLLCVYFAGSKHRHIAKLQLSAFVDDANKAVYRSPRTNQT